MELIAPISGNVLRITFKSGIFGNCVKVTGRSDTALFSIELPDTTFGVKFEDELFPEEVLLPPLPPPPQAWSMTSRLIKKTRKATNKFISFYRLLLG
jgi:hypothetical protein